MCVTLCRENLTVRATWMWRCQWCPVHSILKIELNVLLGDELNDSIPCDSLKFSTFPLWAGLFYGLSVSTPGAWLKLFQSRELNVSTSPKPFRYAPLSLFQGRRLNLWLKQSWNQHGAIQAALCTLLRVRFDFLNRTVSKFRFVVSDSGKSHDS